MTVSALVGVMNSVPIDKTARMVAAQDGCSDDWTATLKNLKEINELLCAIRKEIRLQLGIEDWMNLKIRRISRKYESSDQKIPNEKLSEYRRLGLQMRRLDAEYSRVMREHGAQRRERKPIAAKVSRG